MVCFVCLDNNVLRAFAECGCCVYLCGTKALFRSRRRGNWKIGNRLTDGDNRVATGVFNFAHTNIGIIIFLLSAPIMNKSAVQSCKPSYTGGFW